MDRGGFWRIETPQSIYPQQSGQDRYRNIAEGYGSRLGHHPGEMARITVAMPTYHYRFVVNERLGDNVSLED